MIPLDILRKMNTLKLEMDGVKIQVKVIDNEKLLIEGTEELRNILGLTNCQIVGFDLKPPNFLVLHYKHIYIYAYWFNWGVSNLFLSNFGGS